MYQLRSPHPITPQSHVGLVRYWQSIVALRPNLELSSLGHVLDAFERFVFLAVHVQSVHLQPCRAQCCQRNHFKECNDPISIKERLAPSGGRSVPLQLVKSAGVCT